jgi:hypothetical protein
MIYCKFNSHLDVAGSRVRVGIITNSSISAIPNIHHGWAMKYYTSVGQKHYRQLTVVPQHKQMVKVITCRVVYKNVLQEAAAGLSEWMNKREYAAPNAFWVDWIPIGKFIIHEVFLND